MNYRRPYLIARSARTLLAALLLVAALPLALPRAPSAEAAVEAGSFSRTLVDTHDGLLRGMAFGDVNNDGYVDLVAAGVNSRNNALEAAPERLYLGSSAGLGGPQIIGGADTASWAVALGDVDNDGNLDLVVGNVGAEQLYLGDGSNSPFTSATQLDDSTGSTTALALGDFDGDGYLDLVTGGDGERDRLYRFNRQAGSFGPASFISDATNASEDFKTGDIDGDGDLDLVVGNGNSVRYYLNIDTAGSARLLVGPVDIANGVRATSFDLGDLNGDDYLDLIASAPGGGQVYLNTRNFTPFSAPTTFTGQDELVSGLALGDLDGDGDLDALAVRGAIDGTTIAPLLVYLNTGSATVFGPGTAIPLSDNRIIGHGLGDVDGDGDLDIVVSSGVQIDGFSGITWLFRNDGEVQPFVSTESLPGRAALAGSPLASSVALGDVNGDGALDIVSASSAGELFLNGGERPFSASPIQFPLSGAINTNSVALGDFNGDNKLDLIAATDGPERFYPNIGGDSYFSGSVPIADSGGKSRDVALGDLDGDGDLDLVVTNDGPERIYLNEGGGPLPATRALSVPDSADLTLALALGDLDGDGDLDFVTGNVKAVNNQPVAAPARVYLNNGGADLFAPGIDIPGSADITADLALGDLDGDGDLDLVTANNGAERIYLNNGGPALLGPPVNLADSADTTRSLALGDVDGDGDLDLVTGNDPLFGPTLSTYPERLYLNEGPAALLVSAGLISGSDDQTSAVALGDLDGDGDLDLASANDTKSRTFTNQLISPLAQRNSPPTLQALRPGSVAEAALFSTPEIQAGPLLTVPLTLADRDGDRLRELRAFYSLDGGGSWRPAIAASGTITRGLATMPERFEGPLVAPAALADVGQSSFSLTIPAPANGTPGPIVDVDVRLVVGHTRLSDLSAQLIGPDGTSVPLFAGAGDSRNISSPEFDDEAALPLSAGAAPFVGGFKPLAPLAAFDGKSALGPWTLRVNDGLAGSTGALYGWSLRVRTAGVSHSFVWDTRAGGELEHSLIGQSDSVALRFEAVGGGVSERPYSAATTGLFRVRGTLPRVLDSDNRPVTGALVYRLPKGQLRGAAPLTNSQTGAPQTSVARGYLSSGDPLVAGDRLIALAPISATSTYSLYLTSARPTPTGLDLAAATLTGAGGVLTLTTSPSNTLILLNLDVSLEWDARNDRAFLDRLSADIGRASDLLYDWSDGQVALGNVTVYQDRERWDDAHIRIYATNRMRPNAVKGGIVATETADPKLGAESYYPGQLRMGAVWNRYGDSAANLGDDWARTLAHELGHFALYLDDNYIGLDADKKLIDVDGCRGAMADPYRDDYSEFQPPGREWEETCGDTLSERLTGRSDWETIAAFYNDAALGFTITSPGGFDANPGPSLLPLALTSVRFVAPAGGVGPLDSPVALLLDARGQQLDPLPGRGARGFLFQQRADGERLLDLGAPTVDQLLARGAHPGDRLCLLELDRGRSGCALLLSGYQALRLAQQDDWRPDIRLTPVTSTTVRVEVHNLPAGLDLLGRLYPSSAPAQAPLALREGAQGGEVVYAAELTSPAGAPAFEGFVSIWVEEGSALTRRQAVAEYRLGGNPGRKWGRGAPRGNPGRKWGRGAPVLSSDGQALLFLAGGDPPEDSFYAVVSSNSPPASPTYATPVSRAYRLSATEGLTLTNASLSIGYFTDDVPRGYEAGIALYRYDEAGGWEAQATTVDLARNEAVAQIARPGLYQLMASGQLSLTQRGWNLIFFYPGDNQAPDIALRSVAGKYASIYGYSSNTTPDTNDDWRLYGPGLPSWVNDLAELTYGASYWIDATEATTATVRPKSAATLGQSAILAQPPATLYAALPAGVPAGAAVTATVGGVVCGTGTTFIPDGTDGPAVLVVDVPSTGSVANCGLPGREVLVTVGKLSFRVAWSSGPLDLVGFKTYVPLVWR